jgi:hypothetical protein
MPHNRNIAAERRHAESAARAMPATGDAFARHMGAH